MQVCPYEDFDKACYMWLLNAQHQTIPVSGAILKVILQKNLGVTILKHPMGG